MEKQDIQLNKWIDGAVKYIEKHFIDEQFTEVKCKKLSVEFKCEKLPILCAPMTLSEDIVDEIGFETEKSFSEKLFELVSLSGEKDSDVYKRAGVDRRLYSKIISKADYSPSKSTVLAFVFALKLNLKDGLDLLERAGFTLSHSVRRDVIIEYLIRKKVYNLINVNQVLDAMGENIIGR